MIRPATVLDVPAMVDLVSDAHKRSAYRKLKLRKNDLSRSLVDALAAQSATCGNNRTMTFVSDDGNRLDGMIVVIAQRLYFVLEQLAVQDLFFYVRPGADARTAHTLVGAAHEWAGSAGGRVLVKQSFMTGISDFERVGRVMAKRHGMTPAGVYYEKEIGS